MYTDLGDLLLASAGERLGFLLLYLAPSIPGDMDSIQESTSTGLL